MFELLIVLSLVVSLGVVLALRAVPPELLLGAGAALALFGLVAGVPASIVYHRVLRNAVAARRALPPRWWWRPMELHPHIPKEDRSRVMRWFYAGVATFLIAIL